METDTPQQEWQQTAREGKHRAPNEREAVMANHTSDPETGKDVEDLTKGLLELCESPEEKSVRAVLQSRVEQQHRLVCILKEKADDANKCCRSLEQLRAELEKLRTEDAVKMKAQAQRIQHLERRFSDLANNHEKMIQFKDEHRKRHMQLREENKRLQQENEALFSQTVREKEAEVLQLTARATELSQQLDSLQEKHAYESCRAQERERKLLEALSQQTSAYTWEVDSLKYQLQLLQQKHQEAVAQVEQAESQQRAQDSELQAKLERANKEKEQLLCLAAERGKALEDKQQEIQQLEKKLQTAGKARQRSGKRAVREEAAADNHLKVQELQQQLESSKEAYNELSLQFEAYRKHSMDLLTKEKALNLKLRHFTV